MRKSKPDLSQAHEFGARVFVHMLEAGKLEARAEEAVFVGVDAESKGYRVYWPGRRRVSVERNVTFTPILVASSPSPCHSNLNLLLLSNLNHLLLSNLNRLLPSNLNHLLLKRGRRG